VTPFASIELLHRLTQVGIAYTVARMHVIEARSGEPIGVRRYGDAAALLCRQVPSPHFNAVVGLRAGQESLVAEADDWYRENKIRPISPPGWGAPCRSGASSRRARKPCSTARLRRPLFR
jgi:hypothetical protein